MGNNSVSDIIQDSVLGQIIRLITRNKVFGFPEDDPNFKIPWEEVSITEKEKEIEAEAEAEAEAGSNVDIDIDNKPALVQDGHGAAYAPTQEPTLPHHGQSATHEDLDMEARDHGLTTIPTAHSTASSHSHIGVVTTRTISRERTRPWSRERFEAEQAESMERRQSSVIAPQRTADGIILVDWYTTDDPANPQNWGSWKKAWVATVIFMYTFAVYGASAIYTSAEPQVMAKFGVGESKAALGLSMYVLGYGIGPMLFSPLSELPAIGRNLPYVVSFGLFVILCVPTALSNSYATLLVLRFLTGFMGSPCLATGGATMGDMYSLLKLPYALTAWVAAAFCAPAIGPLLSGFSVVVEGWRWALWEVLWCSAPIFVLMLISMPETSAGNILLRRAQRLRKLTGNPNLKSQGEIDQGNLTFRQVAADQLYKPIEICVKDPAVGFTNVYTSLIYGIYYSFFEAFPLVYISIYKFNIGQLGIVFTCMVVGCMLGIIIYCSYVYWYLEPDILAHGLRAQEHRLVPALFAVTLMPAGIFWFGWTADPNIHWIVGIIGITFYAVGAFLVFQCIFMYLPLTYPRYAASLFAANDLCRSALAAGAIVFARPLYKNLGVGRGISVLGGLLVGGVLGTWALWYWGAKLRARSKFAMTG
ncbi:MFS-type transporter pyvG [Exophiala dermatitidis]